MHGEPAMDRTTRHYLNLEAFQQHLPAMQGQGWTVRDSRVLSPNLASAARRPGVDPMEQASHGAIAPGLARFPQGSALVAVVTAPVFLASAAVAGILHLLGSRKKPKASEVIAVVYERP